ncbi:hypothetical protein NKJ88_01360 [Mesorhizobium sp. M0016]|uniref:hypothetical protein n=1 Tax=Mesorhizobium sp. M0016 TaxID=2956843 RepID=UPI00333A89ED
MPESDRPEPEGLEQKQRQPAQKSTDAPEKLWSLDETQKSGPELETVTESGPAETATPDLATVLSATDPNETYAPPSPDGASADLAPPPSETPAAQEAPLQARAGQPQPLAPNRRANRPANVLDGLRQRLGAGLRRVFRLARHVPAIGFVLVGALVAGFCVRWLVGNAETVLDGKIARAEVAHETVTSLVWVSDDQISIGTASGALYSYLPSTGQMTSSATSQRPVVGIVGAPSATGLRTEPIFRVTLSADLTQQFDPEAPPAALRRVFLSVGAADSEADDGLFAIGSGDTVSVVAGRRTVMANQQQQQQQQVAPQTPTTGLYQYRVSETNDKVEEVGEIGNLSDVRAVAATPDGTLAAAGTGDGQVVAIDLIVPASGDLESVSLSHVGNLGEPVVAVAASGSNDNPVIAAAGVDGRVVVYRVTAVRDGSGGPQTKEGGDNFTYSTTQAGIPATNWSLFEYSGFRELKLVGISQDGRQTIIHKEPGSDNTGFEKSGYLLEKVTGDDYRITSETTLDQPFTDGDELIQLPGVAEAVFLGGAMRTPAQRAITALSTTLAQSKGGQITRVILDRARTRGAIETTEGRIFVFTAQDANPVDLGVSGSVNGALAFSPRGDTLAVLMAEGPLRLYDTATRALIAQGPSDISNRMGEGDIAFSSDGRRIAVTTNAGGIRLYATTTLSLIATFESRGGGLARLAESGDFAARRVGEWSFEVIDLKTGRAIVEARPRGQALDDLRVSADGRIVATVGLGDRGVLVASSEQRGDGVDFALATTPVGPPDRDGLKFSADGSKLMLRTRDGKLYVANISAPETAQLTSGRSESFFRFVEIGLDTPAVTAHIAPDGSFLVAGDAHNSLVLVDLTGAAPQSFELPEHGAVVDHLAISPDGTKVVAASLEGRLRVVDLARARLVAELPLARLASHADTPKMVARRLDDAPGTFPDTAFLNQQTGSRDTVPAVIVFGSHSSLADAQAEVAALVRTHGTSLGLLVSAIDTNGVGMQIPAQIYLREGAYRTAVQVPLLETDFFLKEVRKLAPETAAAYVRVLETWCPNAISRDGYIECGRPTPARPAGVQTN